jgi:hypothetical protein
VRESRCRACNAPLVWATSENGRPMPLDAKPEKRVVVGGDGVGRVVTTHVSHFVTCPKAGEFRKPKEQA